MSFARVHERKTLQRYARNDVVLTPRGLFDELNREFGFTCDVAALPENALADQYFSPRENGLWQAWEGVCWCNPPYSDIAPWVRKAWESTHRGTTTVMLLPVRSDMGWWHDFVLPHAEVRFIRGRVKFEGQAGGAPFPCAVVIFRPSVDDSDKDESIW